MLMILINSLNRIQNKIKRAKTIFRCLSRCKNKKEYKVVELSQRLKIKTVEKILVTKDLAKFRDLEIRDRRDLSPGDDIESKLIV